MPPRWHRIGWLAILGLTFALGAPGVPGEPRKPAPTPRLVAHRGLFRHAPENTRAAFAACRELRLGFELDIRRSKDGHLVCIHDEDVRRTTNGQGKVADLTLAELRKLDAGGWFDPAFAGQRVPTLAEVFTLLKQTPFDNLLIALDIKVDDDAIAADIATLANTHGVTSHLVCIGLAIEAPKVRRALRRADPRLAVAVLVKKAEDLPAALVDASADWIYLRFLPTPAQVAQVHSAGRKVFLSGPLVAGREANNWRRAREAGVDAILTDYPLECRDLWRGRE